MPQHFSDARAVLPRRHPEQKNMKVLFLSDLPVKGYTVLGLRSVGKNSNIRRFQAIPDGSGGYLRDKAGNPVLGKKLKPQGVN